ncbi:hypothetical protein VDG1235_3094 [Verrucomicrobiia bacterium DG1235]|nr:hypothetical protein VDG1235_3094 [Verrucomicrobiae bacterium DG1235]
MFTIIWIAALIDWLVLAITMILIPIHKKDDFELHSSRTLWNPLNVIFISDALTEKGKKIRKIHIYAWGLFPCLIGLGFLVGD